ncbi:M14 metallopeptidase family protein [Parvularcula oceani]|uniref:M14 metallopeptidase family protein n=1 Tax=Parvularcula oceani TaxID=1247963 RepID=UPI0004E182D2|nr:M14 family metallopeptidase [Parvularcula oceani]
MIRHSLARAATVVASLALAFILSPGASGQSFMPGVDFDPAIPTMEEVLGTPAGERITPPEDIARYLRALEQAAPDRIALRSIGRSWQGRELLYAVIGSPQRLADLDGLAEGMDRLADPRTVSPAQATALIESLPGTAWLTHGVHGDEISSSDAALMTAYHLLAARNDPVVEEILENTVVFIDPVQNPDGRARFVHGYYDTLGLEPSGSPIAAERNQPWPGGRTNHYLFDMNRDWFALTQPETRARVAAYLRWHPLVVVDLHEMSTRGGYFFSPEAEPYNPDITADQRETLRLIGRNNARWFDRSGFDYYTREVYDALYPGYGAAWPLFHGSIGTTYEQASARGLTAELGNGEDMSYADTVRHHFTASIATLQTVARNREALLRDFYAYRLSALEEGKTGEVRAFVIPRQADQSSADKLAGILAMQGVEALRAEEAFSACGQTYRAGAYVVPLDQPAGRLVRTLLAEDVPMDASFVAEQDRRRQKGLGVEIYDVTAWSLPLMYNVEVDACAERPEGAFAPAQPSLVVPGEVENPRAEFGFLAPWGTTASARLLATALREELVLRSSDEGFTHEGRDYPAGTLIFVRSENEDGLGRRLAALARETGAEVVGIDASWITAGPNFGSRNVERYTPPRIAMAWDRPTSPTAAGATRFVIERQLGYPVEPVRTADLLSDELDAFDVLILPDGRGYMSVLGEPGGEALRGWVERGGVLIAMDGAARFVADPASGLSSLRREKAFAEEPAEEGGGEEEEPTVAGTRLGDEAARIAAEAPAQAAPDAALGALLRAEPDPDHWLAAGLAPTLHVLTSGSAIYAPLRGDTGTNVVSFAGPEDLLASGVVWEETQRQLAYKPFVTVEPLGRGHLIVFTQNPTTRAYLDGLNVLVANAIFRGPAHADPVR